MPKWCTAVAVHRIYNRVDIVDRLPFDFGDGVRLGDLPEWFEHPAIRSSLGFREEALLGSQQLVLTVEYESDSLEEPDPNWHGSPPRSKQDLALQKLLLVNLAAWLSKPTGFNAVFYAHAEETPGQWQPRSWNRLLLRPLKAHENDLLSPEDLDRARKLFGALADLAGEEALQIAAGVALEALRAEWGVVRFLFLWIVLEGLFGTDSELGYRLALRLAFFNASNLTERRELYEEAKKSYKIRCKIVHGMHVKGPGFKDQFKSSAVETERLVRESLQKILLEPRLIQTFNDEQKKRNAYLDGIIFEASLNSELRDTAQTPR